MSNTNLVAVIVVAWLALLALVGINLEQPPAKPEAWACRAINPGDLAVESHYSDGRIECVIHSGPSGNRTTTRKGYSR